MLKKNFNFFKGIASYNTMKENNNALKNKYKYFLIDKNNLNNKVNPDILLNIIWKYWANLIFSPERVSILIVIK